MLVTLGEAAGGRVGQGDPLLCCDGEGENKVLQSESDGVEGVGGGVRVKEEGHHCLQQSTTELWVPGRGGEWFNNYRTSTPYPHTDGGVVPILT